MFVIIILKINQKNLHYNFEKGISKEVKKYFLI